VFQYLYGAIEIVFGGRDPSGRIEFQYLYGAIEILSTRVIAFVYTGSNTSMVRLKFWRSVLLEILIQVPIPLWCD